jgi:hypothetical protein
MSLKPIFVKHQPDSPEHLEAVRPELMSDETHELE